MWVGCKVESRGGRLGGGILEHKGLAWTRVPMKNQAPEGCANMFLHCVHPGGEEDRTVRWDWDVDRGLSSRDH